MERFVNDLLDGTRVVVPRAPRGRWEFLFVVAPLRLTGGTGSRVNPIAVF